MKIREDIIDLPIKYKKTSTFILAGLYASYVFFDDIKPLYDIATELDINNKILYKKLATETLKTLGVGFCTNLSLQSLGFMQKPRLKNLLSTLTMGLPLTIRYIFNPSPKSLESLIEFSEDTLNPPNPNAIQEDRAKLHLMRGELGHGILQYSKYLETQRDKISDKSFFVKLLTLPLKKLYQVRALLDKRISTQFDYIFSCLENGDESTAYEKVWPRILNQNSSLEIKLAHALSLSKSSRTEEAKNLWHEIIENQKDKLQIIGESRNEVLEITCSEELKGTIIIKIGEKKRKDNFTREAYVLSEAYKSTSISNLFTPALVIHYSDDNEVLITFRRNAKNLDKTINEKSSEASMLSLARLHSLKLKLPEYDLLIELNRRLVEKRLGNPADAYPLFHEIKKLLEKQEGKKITSHCDFFPTNVLDDGTISNMIDLIVDATRGKLNINTIATVGSGCFNRCIPYLFSTKKLKTKN